ncbi:MAG: hypothetical protein JNJ58_08560 [Chitinophagaceae bacterium]|nr:hypothetical protein [Chitinophagaceae bacterium]
MEEPLKKYLVSGFTIRVFSTILFILFHRYVNRQGDCFGYYESVSYLNDLFLRNTTEFFDIILSPFDHYQMPNNISKLDMNFYSSEESLLIKIGGVFSLFTFNSLLAIFLLMTTLSYIGVVKIYQTFAALYPQHERILALAIIFVPSVVFWGTSLTKESICFYGFGLLFHSFAKVFVFKDERLKYFILMMLGVLIVGIVKVYIILAFLPTVFLWMILLRIRKIHSLILKNLVVPFLFTALGFAFFYFYDYIGSIFEIYSLDTIQKTIVTNYEYLTREGVGSKYDLGVIEPNLESIFSKFWMAVNVTLYRPYIWESNKIVMLVSSIDSTFTILVTIWVLLKTGIFRSIKIVFGNPDIIFCIVFSIFFAFAVGLTSGNFGTLIRYKIPILPFYFTALVLIYKKGREMLQPPLPTS